MTPSLLPCTAVSQDQLLFRVWKRHWQILPDLSCSPRPASHSSVSMCWPHQFLYTVSAEEVHQCWLNDEKAAIFVGQIMNKDLYSTSKSTSDSSQNLFTTRDSVEEADSA
eukprot:1182818-Rhodomonas_salina.3